MTLDIATTRVLLDGERFPDAGPPAAWHARLGPPNRIEVAGPPAPSGHRNNRVHVYDRLGVTLTEHHWTYQISSLRAVFDLTEEPFPPVAPYSGRLSLGGTEVTGETTERDLASVSIPFRQYLCGEWSGSVRDLSGRMIDVHLGTAALRTATGRSSRIRTVAAVEISVHADPWDSTHRPPAVEAR